MAWNSLNAESASSSPAELASSDISPLRLSDIAEMGDIPTVQDHFQALLKRRLQVEIESRPPLFPWETEIQEYPAEMLSSLGETSVWLKQLQSLELPAALPEEILTALLRQCQAIAQSSLKQGIKLVRAVEQLYPEQPQTLDKIAGMVLANGGAMRSTAAAPRLVQLTEGYEAANPQQKIALSMLAAQAIFERLSLTVSSQNPQRSRQWLTDQGELRITATYESANQVSVQAELPCGGELRLAGETVNQSAQRSQAGSLNLSVSELQIAQPYQLSVALVDVAEPLVFSLQVVDEISG
ncbi:PatU [Sphaerothrix gracilis]|uniref:PatU n=1 Tax=Sphaerothrix gracilis TaxID=3151835 RepID=UPI0031FD851A